MDSYREQLRRDDVGAKVNRRAGLWAMTLLLSGGLASAAGPDLRLVTAAADQDKVAMRALLKQGVDVNATRADGATALLWAAHFDDLETVDLLLKAGAKVNAADDHGLTPLAQACENANVALVERLLAAGANINAAQTSGLTPLMIAAHTGNLPIVKTLLAHAANVNAATTETKDTALMWAISDQHKDVAQVLVEHHADVRDSSTKGFTPLMFAARNGDIEVAKMLIAAGANVNEPASDGTQVLPFAIINGQDAFAMFLLEQGADPNSAIGGLRALHAAAGPVELWLEEWTRKHGGGSVFSAGGGGGGRGPSSNRRLPLVKALLARGADVNARITTSTMMMSYVGYPTKGAFEPFACGTGDLRGATPLWVAALAANGNGGSNGMNFAEGTDSNRMDSSAEILRTLLTAGADQRLTTDDGSTALMVAAGLGRSTFIPGLKRGRRSQSAEEAVKVLLDAGADINTVNEADFTALHGAAFRGLNEVIQILVERGANINARDYRGRTPYRLAEGSKQSFQFQAYPETAEFIKTLGANSTLGVPGTVQERNRDLGAANANQKE
jgi:ankyrin repeat protein